MNRSFNLISGGGTKPNRFDESLGVKYYEARNGFISKSLGAQRGNSSVS